MNESKRVILHEIRFYACLILSAVLMLISIFTPPEGELHTSVVYMSSIILSVGALCVGVDISGIIREIRLAKQEDRKWLAMRAKVAEKEEDNEKGE